MRSILFSAIILATYYIGTNGHKYSGYKETNSYKEKIPLQPNNYHEKSNSYTAAIRGSQRNVKIIDVPSSMAMAADSMTIHVPPSSQPLTFLLRSRSSPLSFQSTHEPDSGSYQETNSEDEPHVLVHTVTRPVLQEIREIIAPYRKVTQEVKPVQESSETLVASTQDSSKESAKSYSKYPQQTQPKRMPYGSQTKPHADKYSGQQQQYKMMNVYSSGESATNYQSGYKQDQISLEQAIPSPVPAPASTSKGPGKMSTYNGPKKTNANKY